MTSTATFRSLRVRPAAAALAALAVAGVSLAGAPAAVAAPGDSGDLKIHRAGVPHWDTRDDLKVCKFSLSAFNFETVPLLTWNIAAQPPNPAGPTLSGQLTLIAGRGHTSEYALPDGEYLLTWNFTGGVGKQKVFKVDCSKEREEHDSKGDDQGYGEKGDQEHGDKSDEEGYADKEDHGDKKDRPSGYVHAGGGGASGTGTGGGEGDEGDGSSIGTTPVLAAGAAGIAGLMLVRRARRRAHGAA
ncbi:hypothetical protein ACF08N_26235 [Streptomyces sp. NPDC015127]|uniref:hypothetical protein n=1 Tax=Streptomyces sp. NPDC015127 TaxID=3364939 RepID=UPI0036F67C70